MRDEFVDVVAIQGTMRTEFSLVELERLSRHLFAWHWLPSSGVIGHSGGILLGVKDASFEVGSMDQESFSLAWRCPNATCASSRKSSLSMFWRITAARPHFLRSLVPKISNAQLPAMVGGDFNLIRHPDDQRNGNINFPRMQLFNDYIADSGLRELDPIGARFTWTNK